MHRSPAEDQYYLLELSLTAAQLPTFLAQLSSREDVSHARLQSLMGKNDGNRRESVVTQTSSDERAKLFETRVALITAFLNHDAGEPGRGGAARAAATCGQPSEPTPARQARSPSPIQSSAASTSTPAIVKALKADWGNRQKREGTPQRYHGPRQGENSEFLSHNAATFAERIKTRSCFGCTPEQAAAQGPIPHWECKHHGQHASDADRAARVPGSGREGLGTHRA